MPPRIPTRALSSLPLASGSIASSSTLPPPPRTSPQLQTRGLHTSARSAKTGQACPSGFSGAQKRSFHSSSPRSARQKDPYDVLGVGKDAAAGDIKKAYYKLAKQWHPDTNKEKGAQERFVEIQSAYDILSDDSKRKAYDQYGAASTEEGFDPNFARGGGGFGGFQGFGGGFGGQAGNTGDLFESLFGGAFGGGSFGGGGRGNRPVRGDDLETTVTLSFLEACMGAKRKLDINPVVDCKPCSGSGLKPGQKKTTCSTCRGTGEQTFQVSGMFMASSCRACGGEGSTIPKGAKCGDCQGVGRVKERKEVDVEIPAGIEDGMKVKLPGHGDQPISAKGPAGDLYVRVVVKASPVFKRQGTNVYHEAKVPLHVAMLGGRVRIPTLEGDVEVRVREGTQNGEEAVLKGRGVKSVYGLSRDRGDLVVGWKIQIPRSLSPLQKQLMKAFAEDAEGRTPQVHFGSPPSGSETGSKGTTSPPPQSPPRSSSSYSSSSYSSRPSTKSEPIEPEYRSSPQAEEDHGILGKVASVIGGALGWADKVFGSGKGKK